MPKPDGMRKGISCEALYSCSVVYTNRQCSTESGPCTPFLQDQVAISFAMSCPFDFPLSHGMLNPSSKPSVLYAKLSILCLDN